MNRAGQAIPLCIAISSERRCEELLGFRIQYFIDLKWVFRFPYFAASHLNLSVNLSGLFYLSWPFTGHA